MVIGIESERANAAAKTGVEHYAKQLILGLAKIDKTNQYRLYLRTKPQAWFKDLPQNFSIKVMPFPIFWTQIRISLEMLMHPVEVLFIPASSMPLFHPKKTVVTVHDLAFMFYPETYTWFQKSLHKFEDFLVKFFAWKVITVSNATKKDFIKIWKVNPEKVITVHHGYDTPDFSPDEYLELPQKYISVLGTIQPRKNIIRLVDAFLSLKLDHPELEHKLVVAGRIGWKPEETMAKLNHPDILYLGYITDSQRFQVLKNSSLYVLPSLYEGFGIPILEAFASGTPVATSNISSMPEVAGEAAIYFEPKNENDIKRALKTVLFDQALQDNLREKGYERLKQFSWEKCSKETLQVLES